MPDRRQKRMVFQTCTAKMNLSDEVDLEVMIPILFNCSHNLQDFVSRPEKISAAEINAICQEAGLQAVRRNR
jgi:26S proteasome regulatory subunit T3